MRNVENFEKNACFYLRSLRFHDNIIVNTNFEASKNDRFWQISSAEAAIFA